MTRKPKAIDQPDVRDDLEQQIDQQCQDNLRKIDEQCTERVIEKYGHLVPEERIRAMKDLPTSFEERKEFDENYRRAGGEAPHDGEKIAGYSRGTIEPAHVALDDEQIRKTITHERIHQLAHPDAAEKLGKTRWGTDVAEGITEDLAIETLGGEPSPDLPPSYPRERAVAHEARRLCGDGSIEKAYFQGDVDDLHSCLERRLGKGQGAIERHIDRLPEIEERS